MVTQIVAVNPQTKAVYRINGREVFLKCNNMQYAAQLIQQIQAKGGSVQQGRSWLRCDLFGDHVIARLGIGEVNLEEDSEAEIENKLTDFFEHFLKKAKFNVTIEKI